MSSMDSCTLTESLFAPFVRERMVETSLDDVSLCGASRRGALSRWRLTE